ncbi:DUF58 domain-containing protein [Xylophilus sp.]|uniref:DUF58 domain-containing protein n=1 Tax=Xylophilus sp. TaxID=2653893 RepID=UPI002D80A0FC|nr:DUF58 domain-containing protein [Xylophilus sp.]
MTGALRSRLRGWWLTRLPRTDSLLLTQRNIYIVPTPAGLALAATLLLLLASINYQLNLGYLLTFVLAGSALAGMHAGHGTLRGLTLHLVPPQPQFLGAPVELAIEFASTRRRPRHAIAAEVRGSGRWVFTDVPAAASAVLHLAFEPQRRGLQPLPPLAVQTLYPLGTFRAWSVWRPASQVLVYPTPEAAPPPLPAGEPLAGSGGSAAARGMGEFDGVRAYQRGDPLKLVVWKKAAQALATGGGQLVSRDAQQARLTQLWLDAQRTGLPAGEARLSRLTAWVLQADGLGVDYGLRLPGAKIAPGSGPAHRRRCLEALARS